MIISKDLSLTKNEEGFGLALFSWSSARKIIITDDELPLLINALQAEYAAQQSVNPTLLTEPVNHCKPVNGVHAPFCTGHKSQSG